MNISIKKRESINMKAIRIQQTGDYDRLQYSDVSVPELKTNEVLIRVQASAVNFIDTLIRSGKLPPESLPDFPFIPGVECSGVIEAVGSNVIHLRPGQPVVHFGHIGAGTYAEYIVADSEYVTVIPAGVSLDEAAAVPVNYLTAFHMLHNLGQAKSGQTILIHAAAGGVGTALVQLSRAAGLRTIGLVSSDEKKAYIETQGADYGINYNTENVNDKVMAITEGRGIDLSMNPLSGGTVLQDAELLAPFGQIVIFGFLSGIPQGTLEEVFARYFNKSIAIRASDIYTLYQTDYSKINLMLKQIFGYIADGNITPQIFRSYPLPEAGKAHQLLEQGKVQGKLILKP